MSLRLKSSCFSFLFILLIVSSVCLEGVSSWSTVHVPTSSWAMRPSQSRPISGRNIISSLVLSASNKSDKADADPPSSMNPLTKASWFAVEAFGKVFGSSSSSFMKRNEIQDGVAATVTYSLDEPPSSFRETLARLQADNDREYFLSGQVDELIYDPNCVFADPFVEFKGRDRFVENLSNLGSFIKKYSARSLAYQVDGNVVETKFMVKLQLNLPWEPVLAWPWGVRCEIDEQTNLVVVHRESWDIDPWEGVKQIFRKPTVQV